MTKLKSKLPPGYMSIQEYRAKKNLTLPVAKMKRAKNASPEFELQCEVVKWLELNYPDALFCASAGGMRTTMRTAVKMKRAGYRKGFPDLFIYEPSRGYNGCAIELKIYTGGKVSPEQKAWIKALNDRNFFAAVCRGYDDATTTIKHYFLKD